MKKHHHAQILQGNVSKKSFKHFGNFRKIFSFSDFENFQIFRFFRFFRDFSDFVIFQIFFGFPRFRKISEIFHFPPIFEIWKMKIFSKICKKNENRFSYIFFRLKFRDINLHHVIQSPAMHSARRRPYFDC